MTIILLVQGLSARWLGCYGNEWVATPNLDRLAAGGVLYDNCYADGVPEFANVLKDTRNGGPPLAAIRKAWRPEQELVVIDSDAFEEPWHAPQELIDDYDEVSDIEARYAAAITYFDAEFGALWELASDATWVVMGSTGHNFNSEDRDHVPLIAHRPGQSNRRILDLVSTSSITGSGDIPVASHVRSGTTIRTADWTLDLAHDPPRLFHRPEDRFLVHDVARLHPDVVEELLTLSPR